MKRIAVLSLLFFAALASACGSKQPPAATPAEPTTTSSAPAPTASAVATASAAPDAAAPVVTTSVTTVSNEISTPKVTSPDQVILGLRTKFNDCFQAGLKKDPQNAGGSVTLSAKIDKDGKVAAVTPKMLTGFNAAIVKCLSDKVKAASFAPAGGMNYTTSLDIPVSFTTNP